MKTGIVGVGIAGLSAAWLLKACESFARLLRPPSKDSQALSRRHEVTVFEGEERIGGHTATIDVSLDGERNAIDTGFIVFNDRTYPNFIRLMDELGVASQPTEMSFSVNSEPEGIEYAGRNLDSLFAQRGNLLRPAFWRMLRDILRFNRDAAADLEHGRIPEGMLLGDYLARNGYSREFRDWYPVPMGAAPVPRARALPFPSACTDDQQGVHRMTASTRELELERPARLPWSARLARGKIFDRIATLPQGRLVIEDAEGTWRFGSASAREELVAHVQLTDSAFYHELASGGSVGAAESWVRGHWKTPDLLKVMQLMAANIDRLNAIDDRSSALEHGATTPSW